MKNVDVKFSQELLRLGADLVRKHFPIIRPYKDGWTYKVGKTQWEFHGPGNFYWFGKAANAYDARYQGWMAWLTKKGINVDEDEVTVKLSK